MEKEPRTEKWRHLVAEGFWGPGPCTGCGRSLHFLFFLRAFALWLSSGTAGVVAVPFSPNPSQSTPTSCLVWWASTGPWAPPTSLSSGALCLQGRKVSGLWPGQPSQKMQPLFLLLAFLLPLGAGTGEWPPLCQRPVSISLSSYPSAQHKDFHQFEPKNFWTLFLIPNLDSQVHCWKDTQQGWPEGRASLKGLVGVSISLIT